MENQSIFSLLWIPTLVAILAGVLLLIIEYRTKWFAQWRASSQQKERQSGESGYTPLGEFVTPVTELENPVGDWIQIADEVRHLLEKVTAQERSSDDPIVLKRIKPNKNGTVELEFTFWAFEEGDPNSQSRYITYVTVDSTGRIVDFLREY